MTLRVFFSDSNSDPNNIRNVASSGSGALYDIGCYAVLSARHVFEAEPPQAVSLIDRDPVLGADRTCSAMLDFGGGRQLFFAVSTQSCPFQRVQIVGARGCVEIAIPFNAPLGAPVRASFDQGGAFDGRSLIEETLPAAEQYRRQAEALSRKVRAESVPNTEMLDEAIAQARVIGALWTPERSGCGMAIR